MTSVWILVIMEFSFLGPPEQGVVTMKAGKFPYTIESLKACEETAQRLHEQAPKEIFYHSCQNIPVKK